MNERWAKNNSLSIFKQITVVATNAAQKSSFLPESFLSEHFSRLNLKIVFKRVRRYCTPRFDCEKATLCLHLMFISQNFEVNLIV